MSKYTVWYMWGEQPDKGQEPVKYSFETRAELNAFMHGIAEAVGWQDEDCIISQEKPKASEFDNYIYEDIDHE